MYPPHSNPLRGQREANLALGLGLIASHSGGIPSGSPGLLLLKRGRFFRAPEKKQSGATEEGPGPEAAQTALGWAVAKGILSVATDMCQEDVSMAQELLPFKASHHP
ncbi:UNVERIFIED_CONTAM: hypothetical protein K2H54_047098 [Gekko kuhli]